MNQLPLDLIPYKAPQQPQQQDLSSVNDQAQLMNQQIQRLQQMVMVLQIQVASEAGTNALAVNQQTQLQGAIAETTKAFEEHIKELQQHLAQVSQEKMALQTRVTQLESQLATQATIAAKVQTAAKDLASRQEEIIKEMRQDVRRMRANEVIYESKCREDEATWRQAIADIESTSASSSAKSCRIAQCTEHLNKITELRSKIAKK